MRTLDQLVLPLGLFLAAVVGGFLADRAARARRPDGDRGDFWARVVNRVCLFLALPVLLSWGVAFIPQLWQSGWHLLFDLTGAFGWSQPFSYRIALLLPFVIWGVLLLFGVAEKPGGRDVGRWLAGAIGVDSSRLWVQIWTIPFAVVLVAKLTDLGGGPGAYPGAAWGTVAVLLLSLIGVALSAGHGAARAGTGPVSPPAAAARQLRPWPQALEANGIQLRHVANWNANSRSRPVRLAATGNLDDRLRQRGAVGIAPELIEAVDGLLATAEEEDDRSRLIFAPDSCGQAEVVALAAELLEQRFHAATLVITAKGASDLAAELARWLPDRDVAAVEPAANVETNALVVVVDAQVLSDWLLPQLKNPLLLKRFGLIVWWHLEEYTGVLAANLWAISRRLHRLLQAMGRHGVRTLIFVRSMPHGGAQLAAFVRRLLPHPLPVECEVHVESRIPRALDLHILESHQSFFNRGDGRNVQERHRHLPLVAAKVSTDEGWPTFLEVPPDIDDSEAEAFLQLRVGDDVLRQQLLPDSASAAARIRKIEAGEILSLVEIIGQGGRSANDGLPHHVGITLPSNPYVAHLLTTLTSGNGGAAFPTSRRLVCTEAQSSVIRRHLVLALDELPDTRSGLLKNFLWNEEIIRTTLEEIAHEGKLTRREVRFLDQRGELRREHEYKSQKSPTGEWQPLDTIGSRLIDVRDPGAGYEHDEGICMRVDPERITIQAYPHRVFLSGGRRYRIHEWSSVEEALRDRSLRCGREDVYSMTWRIRNSYVFGIESNDAPVGVGRRGKLLSRLTASLQYTEEVFGTVRLTPDLTSGVPPLPETIRLARPLSQSFSTRALILRFPEEEDPVALSSLAEALRHVLPVHLGVEEDALEVVPLTGELVRGRATFGLAIVDLYPGGIGLVDAISDDNPFLLQLLEWSRDWLAACPCQSDQGCARCLRSPASLAANSDQPPLRAAALNLLRQIG